MFNKQQLMLLYYLASLQHCDISIYDLPFNT